MSDVRIRAAVPGDMAAIARIYADAVKHGTATFEVEPPDETEMARRLQTLLAGNYPYLVAERSGLIAGYAFAGPYHLRPAYHWTVEDSIYLDPQFQGQGIGWLLMRQLLADAEFMALLSFVESARRAYRLKASNAALPISTSIGTIPFCSQYSR